MNSVAVGTTDHSLPGELLSSRPALLSLLPVTLAPAVAFTSCSSSKHSHTCISAFLMFMSSSLPLIVSWHPLIYHHGPLIHVCNSRLPPLWQLLPEWCGQARQLTTIGMDLLRQYWAWTKVWRELDEERARAEQGVSGRLERNIEA